MLACTVYISVLRARSSYLKSSRRQCRTLCRDRRRDTQARQTPPNDTSRKIQKRLHSRQTIRVSAQRHIPSCSDQLRLHSGIVFLGIEAHSAQRLEGVIRQDVNASMICFEVIDLFAE